VEDHITYIGLGVHKQGIVVAAAESGIRGVQEYGPDCRHACGLGPAGAKARPRRGEAAALR
jgi:hypothetical protein